MFNKIEQKSTMDEPWRSLPLGWGGGGGGGGFVGEAGRLRGRGTIPVIENTILLPGAVPITGNSALEKTG